MNSRHSKSYVQKIQFIEGSQISKLNQGFHILNDYLFSRGKTFYVNPYKTREYYQTVLQDSGSVFSLTIPTHVKEQLISAKLKFSKSFLHTIGLLIPILRKLW
uniref:Uncharacterized protein n=1 Tax=Lactuca sativa TaxID=4236 RepID=A0A9R1VN92_LACSA|nr:hypothetical protein LSAT_V11C500253910 [Lactuca sativa]